MGLSRRQQAILNQMERALGAGDPQLRSSYADFARRARGAPFPRAEVIAARPVRYLVLGLFILVAVGFVVLGVTSSNDGCSARAWHAVCTTTTATTTGRS